PWLTCCSILRERLDRDAGRVPLRPLERLRLRRRRLSARRQTLRQAARRLPVRRAPRDVRAAAAGAGIRDPRSRSRSPPRRTARLPSPIRATTSAKAIRRRSSAFSATGSLFSPLTHGRMRSEEHTSELQSLTNLVCRLLLE